MSVVANGLKTFKAKLLGKEYNLKINNKVWINVQAKYGMTQKQFQEEAEQNDVLQGIKFIMCVLDANGIEDITEDDLIEKADSVDIEMFLIAYNRVVNEKAGKALEEMTKGDDKGK